LGGFPHYAFQYNDSILNCQHLIVNFQSLPGNAFLSSTEITGKHDSNYQIPLFTCFTDFVSAALVKGLDT